jgi:hypothetical protein
MNENQKRLAQRLAEYGYAKLLGDSTDRLLVESLIREPEIGPNLQGIVNDRSNSWQSRFLASEFLFRYVDMTLQSQCDCTSLQDSYFQALRHNYTGNGVDWGFGKGTDDFGTLGLMVASWGKDLEAFRTGLDDDHPITMNFFWRTPPHFHPPYRVKDFAALILARAHGSAIDLAGSPEDRDRAIAELKQMMRNKS